MSVRRSPRENICFIDSDLGTHCCHQSHAFQNREIPSWQGQLAPQAKAVQLPYRNNARLLKTWAFATPHSLRNRCSPTTADSPHPAHPLSGCTDRLLQRSLTPPRSALEATIRICFRWCCRGFRRMQVLQPRLVSFRTTTLGRMSFALFK